jgi:xylan 1,4-beta-xylosidase
LKHSWGRIAEISWILITACSLPGNRAFAATYSLTVDGGVRQGAIPHFWSECVGTGTMEYCLKPAWRTAARLGAQEAGFKRVRGHGILIHLTNVDNIHAGTYPSWSFTAINAIIDTIRACGMAPIMEVDFMPPSLQTAGKGGASSKPNNWNYWQDLVAKLAQNLESRYGADEVRKWYWEIWNEPDYPGFFISSDQNMAAAARMIHYDTLYSRAVAGLRSVDTNLIYGGPATTYSGPLQDFWKNCNSAGIKFLSNHTYGEAAGNTALATNIRDDNRARSAIITGIGRNLFSLNTEYNSTYAGAGGNTSANCYSMDNHKNAPFIVKSVKLIISDCIGGSYRYPDVLSYWALSDCFDEWWGGSDCYIEGNKNIPFGQVFGLINYQGIRKAAFNAFAMLHQMGTIGLQLTGGSRDADGVDGFATVNADSSQAAVIVYSYYNDLTTTGADDTVKLVINNLPFAQGRQLTVNHYRVDSLHSNPYSVWQRLKSPVSPSAAQWDSLRAHQNLEPFEPQSTIQYSGASISKTFNMPRWSVSLLTISSGATDTKISGGTRPDIALLSIHGATLIVSPRVQGPVKVLVYETNGRLVKQVKSLQRSTDLGAGLAKGMYLALAEAAGIRVMKKIAISR